MRVTYLLDRPELGGGTKVVLQHARLLADRGHSVTIAAQAPQPAWVAPWIGRAVRYLDLSGPGGALPSQDLLVATFWTTIARAASLDAGPIAHFCQGFEEDLEHLAPQREAIREAYRRPLPALTVAPHLGLRLREQFGRDSRLAPAPADLAVSRRWRWRPRRRPWVALSGIFEAPVKGLRTGLAALAALAEQGLAPRLLRISALPATAEERGLYPAGSAVRYLEAVEPRAALAALAGCDLLLFTSMPGEGLGLPLLEAMQLGVPAVASRLPGVEFLASGGAGDGARLVAAGDTGAFARSAAELLASPAVWREQRRRGIAAAARFEPARVALEVEAAVSWAASVASEGVPA